MTNEKKQILLKDLCARLPHHVRCKVWLKDGTTEEGPLDLEHNYGDVLRDAFYYNKIVDIKPYLRPMSSMTDEEKAQVQIFMDIITDENYGDGYSPSAWNAMNGFVQYCDSHHLDHRGLIFKDIALQASEGMYNN